MDKIIKVLSDIVHKKLKCVAKCFVNNWYGEMGKVEVAQVLLFYMLYHRVHYYTIKM